MQINLSLILKFLYCLFLFLGLNICRTRPSLRYTALRDSLGPFPDNIIFCVPSCCFYPDIKTNLSKLYKHPPNLRLVSGIQQFRLCSFWNVSTPKIQIRKLSSSEIRWWKCSQLFQRLLTFEKVFFCSLNCFSVRNYGSKISGCSFKKSFVNRR